MSKSSFLLGMVAGEMHGNHPGAWRMPSADPGAYTDVTTFVRAARTAERGGLDYLFLPDVYEDGVDAFVDEVVPLLRARGLYPSDYPGTTLRENLGVPRQYGFDPRLS